MGDLSKLGVDEHRLTEITKKLSVSKTWFHNHLDEFRGKYKGSFIAIKDEKIIASAPNHEKLKEILYQQFSDETFDEILIEFVNTRKYILLLYKKM